MRTQLTAETRRTQREEKKKLQGLAYPAYCLPAARLPVGQVAGRQVCPTELC